MQEDTAATTGITMPRKSPHLFWGGLKLSVDQVAKGHGRTIKEPSDITGMKAGGGQTLFIYPPHRPLNINWIVPIMRLFITHTLLSYFSTLFSEETPTVSNQ